MNSHHCVKCKVLYQSPDEDAYYCEPCLAEKKRIAAELDAKFGSRPVKKIKTALEEYDEMAKNSPVPGYVITKL